MTAVTPSRRERLRTATVAEIKEAARRLLASGGPPAISLRAIARDMGMSAPGIYRYFPSLDALVRDLCTDLYEELRQAIEAARGRVDADDPAGRLVAMAHAFRHWAVGHRAEFALMFGQPLPGVTAPDDVCHDADDADDAGSRFGAPFLAEFTTLWQRHGFRTPPPAVVSDRLAADVSRYVAERDVPVPPEVVHTYLSGWVRLYGLVAMEVFGHLAWIVSDPEPLFETETAAFIHQLTGDAAGH